MFKILQMFFPVYDIISCSTYIDQEQLQRLNNQIAYDCEQKKMFIEKIADINKVDV